MSQSSHQTPALTLDLARNRKATAAVPKNSVKLAAVYSCIGSLFPMVEEFRALSSRKHEKGSWPQVMGTGQAKALLVLQVTVYCLQLADGAKGCFVSLNEDKKSAPHQLGCFGCLSSRLPQIWGLKGLSDWTTERLISSLVDIAAFASCSSKH